MPKYYIITIFTKQQINLNNNESACLLNIHISKHINSEALFAKMIMQYDFVMV